MTDARVLLCTAPPGDAEAVARALLEKRLVACVNVVGGVRSLYRWQGAIERAEEALLVIKTTADRVPEVVAALEEIHPYDTPEILALPVEQGSGKYLDWLRGAL
jgi:periplasmic divalent cation tolerance protein